MCSIPPPITASWRPRRSGGTEVDCLLGRAALPVDGRRRGLDRKAGLEPRIATDVESLLAELLNAAGYDVL